MAKGNNIVAFRAVFILFFITVLPAFALPVVAGSDFVKKTFTIKSKYKNDTQYNLLTCGDLNLQVIVSNVESYENSNQAAFRVVKQGKPISEWFYSGIRNAEEDFEFFYSSSLNTYYFTQSRDVDEWEAYNVYYVDNNKVTFEGSYEPVHKKAMQYYEAWREYKDVHTVIERSESKTYLGYADNHDAEVMEFVKYIPKQKAKQEERQEGITYTDDIFKPLLNAFDWKNGFVPQYVYKISLDLDRDEKQEDYEVNWQTHTVKPLNANAIRAKKDSQYQNRIVFKNDTLVIEKYNYTTVKTNEWQISYKFTLSKKYNKALLSVYTEFKYTSSNLYDEKIHKEREETLCFGRENYYPYNEASAVELEYFSIEETSGSSYGSYYYGRNYSLNQLYALATLKEGKNSLANNCFPLPTVSELKILIEANPVTFKNVQKYNDVAYYFQTYQGVHEDMKAFLNENSVFLLRKVLNVFPDRAVAWLNLADAEWSNDYYRKDAPGYYKKYLELMQSQGKDMNKVPQRVYERIKK